MDEYAGLIMLGTAAFLFGGLSYFRRGSGGKLGKAIRRSDHWAWRQAVADKRRELDELLAAEPPND